MSQNMLVDRLKFAKRELTALKTAHTRGLGELKVFESQQTVSPTGHESWFWYLTINVEFDDRYAEFPFAYIVPRFSNTMEYSMQAVGFTYTSSHSARFKMLWIYASGTQYFTVISTAPIKSVSYTWSQ